MIVFLIKSIFVIIIVLSIVFGVIVPLVRNMSDREHHRDIRSPVQRTRPTTLYPIQEEVEIPTNNQSGEDQNKKIIKMAKDDTDKTTLLIRKWINEKKE